MLCAGRGQFNKGVDMAQIGDAAGIACAHERRVQSRVDASRRLIKGLFRSRSKAALSAYHVQFVTVGERYRRTVK